MSISFPTPKHIWMHCGQEQGGQGVGRYGPVLEPHSSVTFNTRLCKYALKSQCGKAGSSAHGTWELSLCMESNPQLLGSLLISQGMWRGSVFSLINSPFMLVRKSMTIPPHLSAGETMLEVHSQHLSKFTSANHVIHGVAPFSTKP